MRKLLKKWHPDINGLVFMILGLLMLNGGSFALKTTATSMPIWIELPRLDSWICWVMVWYGFDMCLFGGVATPFLLRPITKLIKLALGEDRIEKINMFLSSKFKKKDKVIV